MKEKVSVIIPTYNGEDYIQRTLDSIFLKNNQDFFEIIVINDGSSDNTIKILKENQKTHKNLVVINKENTGVSDSRNIGLSMAKNPLIMFCDDDDEYEPHTIDNVLEEFAKKKYIDLMVFGRYDVYGNNIRYCNDHHTIKEYNNVKKYIVSRFCTGIATFSVCNKIYRNSIIKNNCIKFNQNISFSEDLDFNLNYMKNIEFVEENYEVNYIRHCNKGSTLYRKNDDFFTKNISLIEQFENKYRSYYEKKIFESLYNHYVIVCLNRLFSGIDKNNNSYSEFRHECKKIEQYLNNNNIELKYPNNLRNNLFFGLFKTKQFLLLYLLTVKVGNVIRKCRN